MHPLSQLVRDIVRLKDAIVIVVGFSVGSFYLGYNWPTPTDPQQPRMIASRVEISSVKAGGSALQGTPLFLQDHMLKLRQEQPEAVVSVVESQELSRYEHFRWIVFLTQDFQSNFGLSARAAYLMSPGQQSPEFIPLNTSGGHGPPYREIAIELPRSEKTDRIAVVLSIYPITPQAKFLGDIKRMLDSRVE